MPRLPPARAARLRWATGAAAGALLLLVATWALSARGSPAALGRPTADLFQAAGHPDAPHPITLAVVHRSTPALVAHAVAALELAGNRHFVLLALDADDVKVASAVDAGRTVAAAGAARAAGLPPPRWCGARRNVAAPPCMASSIALAAAAVVARGHAVLVLSPLAYAVAAAAHPPALVLADAALHVMSDDDGSDLARARLPLRADGPVVTGALWAPARAALAPVLARWALELAGGRSPTAANLESSCARDRACAASGAAVQALPGAAFVRGDAYFGPTLSDADKDAVLLLALDGMRPDQAEYRLRHARLWAGPAARPCANHSLVPPHALSPGAAASVIRAVGAFFEFTKERAVECCILPGLSVGGAAGAAATLFPFDALAAWPTDAGPWCARILPFAGRDARALGAAVEFAAPRPALGADASVPRALIAPALARYITGDSVTVPDDVVAKVVARWQSPRAAGALARADAPVALAAPDPARGSSIRLSRKAIAQGRP